MRGRTKNESHETENTFGSRSSSPYTHLDHSGSQSPGNRKIHNKEILKLIREKPPSNPLESLQTLSKLFAPSNEDSSRNRDRKVNKDFRKSSSFSGSPGRSLEYKKKSFSPRNDLRANRDELAKWKPGEKVKHSQFFKGQPRNISGPEKIPTTKEISDESSPAKVKSSKNEIRELLDFVNKKEISSNSARKRDENIGIFGTFSIKEMKNYLANKK